MILEFQDSNVFYHEKIRLCYGALLKKLVTAVGYIQILGQHGGEFSDD